jgi:hypothetical protein
MKKVSTLIAAVAFVSGCVSNVEQRAQQTVGTSTNVNALAPVSASVISLSQNERWRMTCQGGQGAMGVPIYGQVTRFNPATGRADLIITDRDGYEDSAFATLTGNNLSLFDISGSWAANGQTAFLSAPDTCPSGMLVERI